MITSRRARRQPTRLRLLEHGVRLFAEKGFRETTVGEIESAAGLEPRRGALYRHFPTKEALLEAALEQHLQNLADERIALDQFTGSDVHEEALLFARWLLAEVDREEAIVRILEKDGDRLVGLRERFRATLVDSGYALIRDLVRRWLGQGSDAVDSDALSAVLLGGLVNYRRSEWTFAAQPGSIDEERYLNAWARLCSIAAAAGRRSDTGWARRRVR